MSDRYIYDKDGNYLGKSSDEPPNPNKIIAFLILLVGGIIISVVKSC